jgi:chromate transport protein ChrA
MKTGTLLAIAIFTLVALAHLLRLLTGAEITLNGAVVPQWVSGLGIVVPAIIAWMLWRESR